MNQRLWIFVGLGAWLIASPWILGFFEVNTAAINNVLIGGALAIIALWGIYGKK